jgi:hypothetical protein
MTVTPDLSILVPTQPAREKFWPWLASNIEQSLLQLEKYTVEIDACGTDMAARCLRRILGERANVRVVFQHGITPRGELEITAKRNELQACARGRYLTWMDDDDYRDAQWLAHALRTLEARPEIQGTTARGIYYFDIDRWMHWHPRAWRQAPIPITTVVRNVNLPTFEGGNGEDVRWFNTLSPGLYVDPALNTPIMAISHGNNTSRWLRDARVQEAFVPGLPIHGAGLNEQLQALRDRLREP